MKAYTLKLFFIFCFALLTACETQTLKPVDEETTEVTAPETEKQLTLTEEAERLVSLAEDSESPVAQRLYRAKAARLYIDAGNLSKAKAQHEILQQQLIQIQATQEPDSKDPDIESAETTVALLSADIAIAEQKLTLASSILDKSNPVTQQQQIDFSSARANLEYHYGNYMSAIDRRVQLAPYLSDELDRLRNQQKIWAALSNIPTDQLNTLKSNDRVITGWLDLARVFRTGQNNFNQLEDEILDWGTRHPDHPVEQSFLNTLYDSSQMNTSRRKHIAVILPLDGNLSKASDAIKNGLLSAYYNDSDKPLKPEIRFYNNSETDKSFNQHFEQAIADGATDIIGPLDKTVIDQLLQQRELDIPVLALNYSENKYNSTEDMYQFGLSPADEARQVAELAIQQNKLRAAVFYPDSKWGERLKSTFTEHYEALGGSVLSSADYTTTTNDYRRSIRAMLNLEQSSIRHRRVDNIIGTQTKYEPYRRQDIDMIFLAATHRSARGIMPAFKFHHAGDIDVYSTSHVYTGNIDRDLDRDLDGLIFCDMPWVIHHSSPLYKTFTTNWPQQENYTRLFALGIDAYHLIYNIDYLKDRGYAFYSGQTGNLQLNKLNRVTRKLQWAKFVKGVPVLFQPEALSSENTNKQI